MKALFLNCKTKELENVEINGYIDLKNKINGWLEAIQIPELKNDHIVCYGDEEGKLKELDPIFELCYRDIPYDIVCGNVVFIGDNGKGEDDDLTDNDVADIKNFLLKRMI